MDPKLNYSDPKYRTLLGLNNVGFRLENAGLVTRIIIPNPFLSTTVVNYTNIKYSNVCNSLFCIFVCRFTYHVLMTDNGF
jgi:hypothetical protein